MDKATCVMFTLLFITVIFIVYFFQLSRRIDILSKRVDEIEDKNE